MNQQHALVIGYGSIGARHTEVLRSMNLAVSVVSSHLNNADFPVYPDLSSAFEKRSYDYIVIAVPTVDHLRTLRQLDSFLTSGQTILVEKPLFADSSAEFDLKKFNIVAGYVLRAHPLLRRVKQLTSGKKLYSCCCSCGQYLPDWRPGRDYKTGYSASKAGGGGVLRDLSHELDYLQFIAGNWSAVAALGGKYSSLEIDSDDQFNLLFSTEQCALCSCHVDYLSRRVHRELQVEFENGSLHLDFIAGTLDFNGTVEKISLERNDLFRTMHREAIASDLKYLATADVAWETVLLIDAAEEAARGRKWVIKK